MTSPPLEGLRPAPSFKRRPFTARRRRSNPLLRALVLAVRLVLVLFPIATLVVWMVSPAALALEEIEVTTGERVSPEWVRGRLEPQLGSNLLLLSLKGVEVEVRTHPWVRAVEVRKELPHRLLVDVAEHRPAALLELEDEVVFVSEEGVLLRAEVGVEEASTYLMLRFSAGPEPAAEGTARGWRPVFGDPSTELRKALAVAQELDRLEVAWSDRLRRIEILGQEEYRLEVERLSFPVLVQLADLSDKAVLLDEILPEIRRHFGSGLEAVDLRFARRVVLRPVREATAMSAG